MSRLALGVALTADERILYVASYRLPPHRMQANTSKWNVLLSNSAQFTRGVLCFIRSVLAAASIPALASSSPAWGSGLLQARAHGGLSHGAPRIHGLHWRDAVDVRAMADVLRTEAHAQGLKHRDVLARPELLRQRFATLKHESFERVSGACTADLLAQLYAWDPPFGARRGVGVCPSRTPGARSPQLPGPGGARARVGHPASMEHAPASL